jgi:predicted Zn-dependent protease
MDKKWMFFIGLAFFLMGFAVVSDAESPMTINDRAKLGEVYSLERLKKFDKAGPVIEDLYTRNKDNHEIVWSYVRIMGFGRHWREAMKVFDDLCALKECDEGMFVTFAHILESQGPIPETLVHIKKLADQHPNNEKIQSVYKEILSWDIQNAPGQQSIEELSKKYPDDLQLKEAYAQALVEQKKYADAISQMNSLLAHNPNDKDLRFQHAKVISATGNHQQAIKELQAVINDGFVNKEAVIMLGDELRLTGRDEEALKVYQGVIDEK